MTKRPFMACGAIGAALMVCTGCSEPVPPAAQGATIVFWQTVSPSSTESCAVQDVHQGAIGYADQAELRDLRRDTENGAQIFCVSSDNGGGSFNTEGFMRLADVALSFAIPNMSTNATFDNPAKGSISYSSLQTAGRPYKSTGEEPCNFWFAASTQQEVAAGRLWVQFGCPRVVDASVNSACAIDNNSTIAVQNCEQ